MDPAFKDNDAIFFLKSEFGSKYCDIYEKITKMQQKNYKILSFFHYKNYAILNLLLIYDYYDYIDFLKKNNLDIIKKYL